MDRREFLKSSSGLLFGATALGGLASYFPTNILASNNPLTSEPHFFLTIRLQEGLDNIFGLNPWTADFPNQENLFLGENYQVLQNTLGTDINLGPSALALEKHVHDIAIINGVFMGPVDIGHPAALHYMTSAQTDPQKVHFITELAENLRQYKQENEGSILVKGDLRIAHLKQINRAPLEELSNMIVGKDGNFSLDKFTSSQIGTSKFSEIFKKVDSNKEKMKLMKNKLAEIAVDKNTPTEDELIAAAFAADAYRFAQIDIFNQGVDAHSNFFSTHPQAQKELWTRVSKLFDKLKSLTYLDTDEALFPNYVTVLVITEFSRLPFLNSARGKDHNFFDNSVLLAGKGIKGGTQVGDHHLFVKDDKHPVSQLSGVHIDYLTGETVKNSYYNTKFVDNISSTRHVDLIRPSNVYRTLAEIFQVDYRYLKAVNQNDKIIPEILA